MSILALFCSDSSVGSASISYFVSDHSSVVDPRIPSRFHLGCTEVVANNSRGEVKRDDYPGWYDSDRESAL